MELLKFIGYSMSIIFTITYVVFCIISVLMFNDDDEITKGEVK